MPDQTASNVLVSLRREDPAEPFGTPAASGAGATQLRIVDSPGLTLARTSIQSNERRRDRIRPIGRAGNRSVGGTFNSEITLGGGTDLLFESIMRTTFVPALAIAPAGMAGATITTTATTINASGGEWRGVGLRMGDVFTLGGHPNPANNNLRLRVVGLTATVITVAGIGPKAASAPLVADAAATANWTVTVLKKLVSPLDPGRHSYTIEQYDVDIDSSELFVGCRLSGMTISLRPDAIATFSYTFVGKNRIPLQIGTSPWFTNPSVTDGESLVSADGAIRFNGQEVTRFTGLDINLAIETTGQATLGAQVTPDVYDGDLTISGTMNGIREDFTRLQMFENETLFELGALLVEPGTAPLGALGLFLPRVKFTTADAPAVGGNGPKIETLNISAGRRAASTGYDSTAVNVFSSAA
jgi:hypothetical protein